MPQVQTDHIMSRTLQGDGKLVTLFIALRCLDYSHISVSHGTNTANSEANYVATSHLVTMNFLKNWLEFSPSLTLCLLCNKHQTAFELTMCHLTVLIC